MSVTAESPLQPVQQFCEQVMQTPVSPQWVAIVHDDDRVVDRVRSALDPKESLTLVRIAQRDWDFASGDWIAAMTATLDREETTHLLLVGHSLGAAGRNETGQESSLPAAHRPLQGAHQVQRQTQRSKDEFADAVDALVSIPAVANRIASGTLEVHTLFFLDHGQTFVVYSAADRRFGDAARETA